MSGSKSPVGQNRPAEIESVITGCAYSRPGEAERGLGVSWGGLRFGPPCRRHGAPCGAELLGQETPLDRRSKDRELRSSGTWWKVNSGRAVELEGQNTGTRSALTVVWSQDSPEQRRIGHQ